MPAKLSPTLWDEAIKCACILYNLNPHQGINSLKSRMKYFLIRESIYLNLKFFGSKVFFLNRYKQRKF